MPVPRQLCPDSACRRAVGFLRFGHGWRQRADPDPARAVQALGRHFAGQAGLTDGGVFSERDALENIQAGASLVQFYTSLSYAGPALIPRLKAELAAALRGAGFACVRDAIGSDAERLAGAA